MATDRDAPEVSFVIPARNEAAYLPNCLDAVAAQRTDREYDTAYCPDVLVATSARRIAESGLTGTLYHYLKLDWRRIAANY